MKDLSCSFHCHHRSLWFFPFMHVYTKSTSSGFYFSFFTLIEWQNISYSSSNYLKFNIMSHELRTTFLMSFSWVLITQFLSNYATKYFKGGLIINLRIQMFAVFTGTIPSFSCFLAAVFQTKYMNTRIEFFN